MKITVEKLKALMDYNPKSGEFTWLSRAGARVWAGDVAGCRTPRGYIVIRVDGEGYLAHRLAFLYMTGGFPKDQVDHINHDKADNRWKNLRPATNKENRKNLSVNVKNTSGAMGVCYNKEI